MDFLHHNHLRTRPNGAVIKKRLKGIEKILQNFRHTAILYSFNLDSVFMEGYIKYTMLLFIFKNQTNFQRFIVWRKGIRMS